MRLTIAICLGLVALAGAGSSSFAAAANLCVGGPHCLATIQSAVDAAHDGDSIDIAPGTFAGGITIDVSVDVRGAGAGATIIRGGGPVVTIGEEQGAVEPTVSLSGVTITGGVNTSFPDHAVTQGGGVRIPQGSFQTRNGVGATVTITDSVISGNSVYSTQLLPPGFCGPIDCSFAAGAGIFSDGTLTLIDTRVVDNQAGEPGATTTNADGGGIAGSGTLTLLHSFVTGNRAVVTPPAGAGAFVGGVEAGGDTTIRDSVISGNTVEATSTLPGDFELRNAIAGGLVVGTNATITGTIVSDNTVTARFGTGTALAVSGGIQVDGTLVLTDSTVARNVVSASGGTPVAAQGGLGVAGVATIRNSRIAENRVAALSPSGTATAGGGGIGNFGQLTLEKTLVIGNTVTARGASGAAQGGGINNFSLGSVPQLTLTEGVVAANRLVASPGVVVQGGGLHTDFPVTLTRTVIAGNKPDQCYGC